MRATLLVLLVGLQLCAASGEYARTAAVVVESRAALADAWRFGCAVPWLHRTIPDRDMLLRLALFAEHKQALVTPEQLEGLFFVPTKKQRSTVLETARLSECEAGAVAIQQAEREWRAEHAPPPPPPNDTDTDKDTGTGDDSETPPPPPPPPPPPTILCTLLSDKVEQCEGSDRLASETGSLLPCKGQWRVCRYLEHAKVLRCACNHHFYSHGAGRDDAEQHSRQHHALRSRGRRHRHT